MGRWLDGGLDLSRLSWPPWSARSRVDEGFRVRIMRGRRRRPVERTKDGVEVVGMVVATRVDVDRGR